MQPIMPRLASDGSSGEGVLPRALRCSPVANERLCHWLLGSQVIDRRDGGEAYCLL